jgi:sortase A
VRLALFLIAVHLSILAVVTKPASVVVESNSHQEEKEPSLIAQVKAVETEGSNNTAPTPRPDSIQDINTTTAIPKPPNFAPGDSIVAVENPLPARIVVDKINLSAPIVSEGQTDGVRMGVPSDNATVGWWGLGRKPGELGSSVLAGHYKVADGSPGVFYRLNELRTGDEIKILLADHKEKLFIVENIEIYKESAFPLRKVFATRDARRLNLITCTGEYIAELDDYSHRMVVFAKMLE